MARPIDPDLLADDAMRPYGSYARCNDAVSEMYCTAICHTINGKDCGYEANGANCVHVVDQDTHSGRIVGHATGAPGR
eukprot:COSAG06_NODE_663_length_13295_cov_33.836945_4_plen_78_part_00